MRTITKIPTIHIEKYEYGEDVLELSLMMDHSQNKYYMTEDMIRAFAENILESLEKSMIFRREQT